MNVTTFFTQVNSAYRGSDDDAPTTGTDFTLWLATTNRKINEWASDSNNQWASLFANTALATPVAAGTQTYNLGSTLIVPADRVYVVNGTNTYYYTICKPQERDRFSNSVYIAGSNPQKLTFVDTISATSPIVGGTTYVAGYFMPADLTAAADTIPVDDPYWLVNAVASELAFNDITYSDKAPDLNAKANNLYSGMVAANRRGTSNNPRTARTSVNRIINTSSESGVGTI